MNQREGLIFVVSAPSGAGKTSLVKSLLEDIENISVCVSHTTRPPREGEVHGEDYYFTTKEEFEFLIKKDVFVEYAKVFDHYYGTSKAEVLRITTQKNEDIILEIDWQGARQVMDHYQNSVGIFILPPSLNTLKERLEKRAKDSACVIKERLEKAKWEIQAYSYYDYLLINDDFNRALKDLITIIQCERIKGSKADVVRFINEQLLN